MERRYGSDFRWFGGHLARLMALSIALALVAALVDVSFPGEDETVAYVVGEWLFFGLLFFGVPPAVLYLLVVGAARRGTRRSHRLVALLASPLLSLLFYPAPDLLGAGSWSLPLAVFVGAAASFSISRPPRVEAVA